MLLLLVSGLYAYTCLISALARRCRFDALILERSVRCVCYPGGRWGVSGVESLCIGSRYSVPPRLDIPLAVCDEFASVWREAGSVLCPEAARQCYRVQNTCLPR